MKKLGLVLGAVAFAMMFTGGKAYAKTYEENGFKYEVHNKQATIVGGEIKDGSLKIPSTIGGFPVVKIGSYAFQNAKDCTSISMPDSITQIGYGAFSGMKKVTSVKLPKNLKKIEYSAFNKCTGLVSVKFNSCLEKIGSWAFADCIKLGSVSLPSSVKKIEGRAFSNCYKLSHISMGNKVEQIGAGAFYKNYALKSITIPASVKQVEDRAFYKCDSLTNVKFMSGKTKLGNYLFSDCTALKKVALPNKLTSIPEGTFQNCTKIPAFTLSKKVSIIKKKAFLNCSSLAKVNLNKKVYAIGDQAFSESGLKSIKLNANMQFVGNGAFRGTKIKKLEFKNKVTYIGNRVFADCQKLKKIIIPASVKGINPGAFNNCTSLSDIQVASGNAMYSSQAGVLYDKAKTKLIQYPQHKTSKTFKTPSSLKSIRKGAFSYNDCLENVVVKADTIGESAFAHMEKLKTVKLLNGVRKIERTAFWQTENLKSIDLADSVEKIGESAFAETGIRTLHIPSHLKKFATSALEGCKDLQSFSGGNGGAYRVKDGVLYNAKMNTLIKYPAKKTGKTFMVPNTVKNISGEAFAYANHLTKIEFGKNLSRLGYHAIYKAKNLKSIVFTSKRNFSGSGSGVSDCDNLAVVVGPSTGSLSNLAYCANATLIAL